MAAPLPLQPPAAPAELQIPDAFRTSYSNIESYPSNLIHKNTYPAALEGFAARLNKLAPKLFRNGQFNIPFLEFTGIGANGGLQIQDIKDDVSLREWLGDFSASTPAGGLVTRADPKCRFIFINANSGRDPLNISPTMLRRILTYHQVMPNYLEFLSVFGAQIYARDLRFSGFRGYVSLAKPARILPIPALARSGRQYQLCYNLKTVACKSRAGTALSQQLWSIRHGSFHHQFDVEHGTTLWIVTQGQLIIRDRITDMTSGRGRPEDRAFGTVEECFRTSLTTHLLFCHWSTEEWRCYIQWLEEVIESETESAKYATRGANGQHIYTPEDIQNVQLREDTTNEAIMVLEANTDVLSSLRNFYQALIENTQFDLRSLCETDVINFMAQIDDMIYDSKMQIARAKVLVKITADRKSLILQHLQSQATEQMEDLTRLTIKIGTMSQREAIAMRIITVVTLIYLPATFVSTFFSTDIIKYQNIENSMGSFSEVALMRWLQVTLPLTALTLAIGWLAFVRSEKKADEDFGALQLPAYASGSKTIYGNPIPVPKYRLLSRFLSLFR